MLGPLLLTLAAAGCSGSEFSASASGGSGGTLAGGAAGEGGAVARGGAGAGSIADAGDAGSSVAGSPDVGAGYGGAADEGGSSGEGALGPAGSGGTLGDAGAGGAGDAGACTASQWFADADGDDYGRTTAQVEACAAPAVGKWVLLGGDCNDDDALVSPKQTDFKSVGYAVTAGVSFDYDCSGQEQADPTALGAAPVCNLLACSGSGFAGTGRTGVGVNPLCGSKTLVTCVQDGLTCKALKSQVSEGVRCR